MSMLLTQSAMEAMQAHDGVTQTGPIEMKDGKAYLHYDTIEILNARNQDPAKTGLLIGFKYGGTVMAFMHTEGTELVSDMALNVNGVEGRIQIEVVSSKLDGAKE